MRRLIESSKSWRPRGMFSVSKTALASLALFVGGAVTLAAIIGKKPSDSLTANGRFCALGQSDLGKFVDIPGGGFIEGADPQYPEEGPPEKTFVSPFRLQAHEVTNSQFAAFVNGDWLCDGSGTKRRIGAVHEKRDAGEYPLLVETRPRRDLANAERRRFRALRGWRSIPLFM